MAQCLYRFLDLFQPAPSQATRNTTTLETTAVTLSWDRLPAEIRRYILDFLCHEPRRKHVYATVCREWRIFMEEKTFRKLTVCQHGLAGLAQLSTQPRAAIKHLWFNMEITGPPCPSCLPTSNLPFPILNAAAVPNAEDHIHQLFRILSSWGCCERGLTLEFNAYCPQEQAHWLKNWFIGCPGESRRIPTLTADERHCWRKLLGRSLAWAIVCCFPPISLGYPLKLPPADAVTKFVIRRYCRNRFRPSDIARLVNACPRLLHLHLETWAHSNASDITSQNPATNPPQCQLIRCLALNELFILKRTADDLIANIHPSTLRTLTVFQDLCLDYLRPARLLYGSTRDYVDYRRWVRENTEQFAARSLDLQVLSVSFLALAEDFFSDCQPDWTWKSLETIILTTAEFTDDLVSGAVSLLLQDAAQVALRMPRLETMVLWNTKRGRYATSFTYRRTKLSATIAWCSTVDLDFDPDTVRAWEEVARKHGQPCLRTEKRRIGRWEIISPGHAIRLLELPPQVIDPESRRQIEKEYEVPRIPGVHCTPCKLV
ncbi:Oxoglutarate iron-dependent oxygenase [Fusarium tjaetaba]|uniref:Oxoglutarate iron-dependent oxygenase n=1 Tax=Fusarium tjaetaba TaxID=1567544 RepID=A0A8H5S2R4_9HYPO|nr:Oxoglutarate iron-dependent oxygenase [Fusarium tjaetaba]KAF5643514.1 Oxoglutarate iron-dependent oxygenase [Fusarium tjaetaba]